MAAAIRGRVGQISHKYFPILLAQTCKFRVKLYNGFHQSSALYVAGMEIKMPSLSPTMAEGTIVKWLKKEGDPIAPGDVLCDIQTDKAVVSMETEEEGTLAKILIPEDTKDIKVGTLIALMVGEGEDWKDVEIPTSTASSSLSTEQQGVSSPISAVSTTPSSGSHQPHSGIMGPAVRTLLEHFGLKSSQVPATGPKGNLLKGDILQLVAQQGLKPAAILPVAAPGKEGSKPSSASAPAPATASTARRSSGPRRGANPYVDIELTSMRKTIAKRLTQSKTTIPHSYGSIDCDISEVLRLRKALKADGIAVSVNDFVIKAVGVALRQCPEMNCLWMGEQAKHSSDIDVSVAVATEAGLITPIVKAAADKGVQEISASVRDLAGRAKQGKLQLHEFQGGSFTISNLGMFGVNHFSAIINPPQCGILAVGSGRVVIGNDGKPSTKMTVTLSYDRRAVDEEQAANFLSVLEEVLGSPSRMILGSVPSSSRARVGEV